MTDQQHPITPLPELVQQWASTQKYDIAPTWVLNDIATRAAQWGSDQELEACIDWIANARNSGMGWDIATSLSADLRAFRRPEPSSLKEQALIILDNAITNLDAAHENILRRALEQLDD